MPEPDLSPWEAVAKAVRDRRAELHLTQAEAAHRGDISELTWGLVENARQQSYKERSLRGVARSLAWPLDAIQQILDGVDPSTLQTIAYAPTFDVGVREETEIPAGLARKISEATPEERARLEAYLDGLFASRDQ